VRGGSLPHVPHLDSALGDLGLGGGWHGDGTGRPGLSGGWLTVHDVCPVTIHPVVGLCVHSNFFNSIPHCLGPFLYSVPVPSSRGCASCGRSQDAQGPATGRTRAGNQPS
jgi:hypothetical protein